MAQPASGISFQQQNRRISQLLTAFPGFQILTFIRSGLDYRSPESPWFLGVFIIISQFKPPVFSGKFPGSSMVEHATVNRRVVGSSPTRGAIRCARPLYLKNKVGLGLLMAGHHGASNAPSLSRGCYHQEFRKELFFI